MKYRWLLAPAQDALVSRLANKLKVSPLLAQCLVNRRLDEPAKAEAFLQPRLKQLGDPDGVPNLTRAVELLWQARQRGDPVAIFGDYDVDGITATALLLEVLRPLGWTVCHYLPHRIEEGYGLTQDGVENCLRKHRVALLLAVDCGSTSRDTVAWLRHRGVEVIVLDHHQLSSPAPEPAALVNPHAAPDNSNDLRHLCSAGLAFKLAHGLIKKGRQMQAPGAADFDLKRLLDLVALGTIADLVPLLGENRILVSAGLERINQAGRPGLQALRSVARVSEDVGTYEVAFQLAPRLNAAGRLESAGQALDLLLAEDLTEADRLARSLDGWNRDRQRIERTVADEVIGRVRAKFDPARDYVILEGHPDWHLGIIGIVASRVLHEFHRPTIILGGDGSEWRGSGRSVEGFDIAAALRECRELLLRHGGHPMAAGLTVRPENIDTLRDRLNVLARNVLTPEQLTPGLRLDAEVSLRDLTVQNLAEMQRLQPFGQGNPQVHVIVRQVAMRETRQRIGKEGKHLKFRLTDGHDECEVVWWGGADQQAPSAKFDLACVPQLDSFGGQLKPQLKFLDWRPAQPGHVHSG